MYGDKSSKLLILYAYLDIRIRILTCDYAVNTMDGIDCYTGTVSQTYLWCGSKYERV